MSRFNPLDFFGIELGAVGRKTVFGVRRREVGYEFFIIEQRLSA